MKDYNAHTRVRLADALDSADRWLLKNDPELANKSPEYLVNKKIRNTHFVGSQLCDDMKITVHQEESQGHEAFLQFVEKQNWINPEAKKLVLGIAQDQSLRQIGQSLGGISKQAVHKKLKKNREAIQYLIKIWQGQGRSHACVSAGSPVHVVLAENNQLAFDFDV